MMMMNSLCFLNIVVLRLNSFPSGAIAKNLFGIQAPPSIMSMMSSMFGGM
jgi:hypothetical protein